MYVVKFLKSLLKHGGNISTMGSMKLYRFHLVRQLASSLCLNLWSGRESLGFDWTFDLYTNFELKILD
jgi:hypothetical protein